KLRAPPELERGLAAWPGPRPAQCGSALAARLASAMPPGPAARRHGRRSAEAEALELPGQRRAPFRTGRSGCAGGRTRAITARWPPSRCARARAAGPGPRPISARRRIDKMIFKRSIQRYGRTPEPDTPYSRAGQMWDERIG